MSESDGLLQIGQTGTGPDKVQIVLTVNGEDCQVLADGSATLLEVLREELNLPGTKHGCELGECGACTILLDGEPVLSCLLLARQCQNMEITTIEGISEGTGLHPLQEAFADLGGSQCGYCTPGFILSSAALLHRNPDPNRGEIKEALSGNLCRCTGYNQIFESVEEAARKIRRERS